MSLKTNLDSVFIRVGTEFKSLRTLINGNVASLAALTTSDKTNLVAAINEVAASVGTAGAVINDTTASATQVYSSSKTMAEIQAAVNGLIDGAPGALDTLNELAAAIGDNASYAASITTALAGKVGNTGDETIAGIKTFSSAPIVPDGSFAQSKVTGLTAALAGKITGFTDPNADRIVFWDDSASAYAPLTLNGLSITGTELTVSAATATAAGKVELATDAEAVAGTDTVRAITPANLLAVVGDSTASFVTTFEAALV